MLPAVLKITNREEEQILRPDDDPSVWARGNSKDIEILLKFIGGFSGEVLNDIKKAYAIAIRGDFFLRRHLFDAPFVADYLITATLKPNRGCFLWTRTNRKPSRMPYSYLLKLDSEKSKWRLEGQKNDHGIFLLDEWGVEHKDYPDDLGKELDVYAILDRYAYREKER